MQLHGWSHEVDGVSHHEVDVLVGNRGLGDDGGAIRRYQRHVSLSHLEIHGLEVRHPAGVATRTSASSTVLAALEAVRVAEAPPDVARGPHGARDQDHVLDVGPHGSLAVDDAI